MIAAFRYQDMYGYILKISLVVSLVLVAGCSSSRRILVEGDLPSTFPHHTENQITSYISAGTDSLGSFEAKANIAVRSPSESLSFSSNITHRRSDSLYMSIKPALGIEAGRALVTPDSFFVYDRIKKKLYYGDIDKAGEFLPGPISQRYIFGNLLGLPELASDRFVVEADSAHYILTDSITNETYTIDPRIWRVVKYERFGVSGSLVESMTYEDFDQLDGVVLPRRVIYEHKDEGRSASIFYRSIDLNPEDLDMTFEVSDSATPVPIQ